MPEPENDVPLAPNKCWCDYRTAPDAARGRPCLLLDRDGVVVEEVNYLHTVEQTRLIDGAAKLIATANNAGWLCGLITNQSGIGRGMFDWQEFQQVQDEIDRQLTQKGAHLDFVLACPFHKDAVIDAYRHPVHPWRKPNPGMIKDVVDYYGIDAQRAVLVGDTLDDLLAGKAAGVKTLVHVTTGHGMDQRPRAKACAEIAEQTLWLDSIAAPELADIIIRTQTL